MPHARSRERRQQAALLTSFCMLRDAHNSTARTAIAVAFAAGLSAQSQWTIERVMWPRSFAAMVHDSTAARVRVFGGAQANTTFGETWSFDGNAWTNATQAPPGIPGDVVHDPVRDRFVAVINGNLIAEWDRTNWTLVAQPNTFSNGRWMLAYDQGRQVTTLVISDVTSTEVHDYNGAQWTQRNITGAAPAWNVNGRIAYDLATNSLLSLTSFPIGGALNVWRCAGTTWQQVVTPTAPPPLEWFSTARDPITSELLVFGGYESIQGFAVTRNALWAFNGATWRLVPTPVAPATRYAQAMANDDQNARVLMYGGGAFQGNAVWYGDLWSWNGSSWTQLAEPAAPLQLGQQVNAAQSVFDRGRGVILAHPLDGQGSAQTFDGAKWTTYPCGSACPSQPSYLAYHDQASAPVAVASNGDFAWTGAGWAQLPFAQRPVVRVGSAVASTGSQLVLFGGLSGSSPTNQTWTLDATGWTQQFPNNAPPPMAGHRMASMPSRGEVVLVTTNNRTWTWDGVDWTDRGPMPFQFVQDFALHYLPERDRAVFHGGFDYSQPTPQRLNAVWEWDGVAWQSVALQNSPSRAGHRLVEGPGQRLLILPTAPNPIESMGSVAASTSAAYGQGCLGAAGVPQLFADAWSRPRLGDTFRARGRGLPNGLTLLMLGFRDDQWAGQALPLSLATVGMPGCDALLEPFDVLGALSSGGQASWSLSIPSDPALLAATFFQQALVIDPTANAFGATVSNGLRNRVGRR